MISTQNKKAIKVEITYDYTTFDYLFPDVGTSNVVFSNDQVSEYEEYGDEGFNSPLSANENKLGEPIQRKRHKHVVYNPACDHTNFDFIVDMVFENENNLGTMCKCIEFVMAST